MCQFITALLPESADLAAVKKIFDKHQIGFTPVTNLSLQTQVAPGDHYVLTTRGRCDCGTPLGSGRAVRVSRGGGSDEAHVRKLRKQGWSDAKILRWQAQKTQEAEKRKRVQEARAENNTPFVDAWRLFLIDVLESGEWCDTPRISLLLRWCRYSVARDSVVLAGQGQVTRANLTNEQLLSLVDNVVYHYVL